MDIGNLISYSTVFSKSSLYIWKFSVRLLLKPSLEDFEHYLASMCCSNKIERRLLLKKKKVMTNLDSVLKSRNISLPTKVCLVKVMVFPVVMYGCENWTIKKAEHGRTDALELWF